MTTVSFSVAAKLAQKSCGVYVVGDCPELGKWDPTQASPLQLTTEDNNNIQTWQASVTISGTQTLRYRYFIGRQLQTSDSQAVIVCSWEGGSDPRELSLTPSDVKAEDTYGDSLPLYPGWLTSQTQTRLHFRSNCLTLTGHQADKPYTIHCQPFDASQEFTDSKPSNVYTEMYSSDVSAADSSAYVCQSDEGVEVRDNSYISFCVQSCTPDIVGIMISLRSGCVKPNETRPVLGQCVVMPTCLTGSAGSLTLAVTDMGGVPVGNIAVSYLVVRPLPDYTHSMETSSALYWNRQPPTLDIGHRGMGKCRARQVPPHIRENTVVSFNTAAKYGADMVEFDIQVTQDGRCVVFHDFLCRLPCIAQSGGDVIIQQTEQPHFDSPVGELSFRQLKAIKIGFASETGMIERVVQDNSEKETYEERLFPTMAEVFKEVDQSLGFGVEIKHPLLLQTGEMEDDLKAFEDMNNYVDTLLKELLSVAGTRSLFLCCFDPDICIMLRQKQNRYPVQYLTSGVCDQYTAYMDPRTRDIPMAMYLSKAEGFTGINPLSDFLLDDPGLMTLANDLDLAVICWGGVNCDCAVLDRLRKIGVNGIIYDRLNEFISPEKSRQKTV